MLSGAHLMLRISRSSLVVQRRTVRPAGAAGSISAQEARAHMLQLGPGQPVSDYVYFLKCWYLFAVQVFFVLAWVVSVPLPPTFLLKLDSLSRDVFIYF